MPTASLPNYRAGGREGRPRPTDEWRTPPDLFKRLDREFGFVLDAACTTANKLTEHGLCADLGRDGLLESWHSWGGPVWCNPPFSHLTAWVHKASVEGRAVPVVLIVPADTSTKWWLRHVAGVAAEVRFMTGRPRFLRPDGSQNITARGGGGATTPCAVLVYRPGTTETAYSYMLARG